MIMMADTAKPRAQKRPAGKYVRDTKGVAIRRADPQAPTLLFELDLPPRTGKRVVNLLDLKGIVTVEGLEMKLDAHPLGKQQALLEMGFERGIASDVLDALAEFRLPKKEQEATEATEKNGQRIELPLLPEEANGEASELGDISTPTLVEAEEFRRIPIGKLFPSKTNPRKHFDDAELAELAESIRAQGIIEPIIVRPAKAGALIGHYEIVAGERRLRAAKLAELKVVPAIIRQYSDLQVLEAQLVENLRRKDLDALEEAGGYQQLLDRHGYTVKDLATKIGKAETYVYGILKLLTLPDKAVKALAEGTLSKSHCQLIARIPSDKLRSKAADDILAGRLYPYSGSKGEPLSLRETQQYMRQHCMVELKQAPFNRADADLPGGPCTTCPKMTGNDRLTFPDSRGDVCTDPACYKTKVAAHQKRLVERAKEAGRKVLTGKAAEKVLDRVSYSGSDYIDLAAQCYDDRKSRSYKALVGKELDKDIVVAQNRQGELKELVPKAKVAPLLKEKGIKRERYAENPSYAREMRAARAKEKIGAVVRRKLMGAVAEKGESAAATWFTSKVEQLRQVVLTFTDANWSDICRVIAGRRGWERKDKGGYPGGWSDTVAGYAKDLSTAELVGLLAELAAGRQVSDYGRAYSNARPNKSFFEAFGINAAKIEAGVKAELKAKKKSKPSKNGKRRPAEEEEDDGGEENDDDPDFE
jgi:ParB/RepB/Spo0J family partition protein